MSVKMRKQHIFIIENNLQKVVQSFFHCPVRQPWYKIYLVRRQFSLVPDNRTNVNVEACNVVLNRGWMSIFQKLVHKLSNTSTKLFPSVAINVFEEFESLTTSFWMMDMLLFSRHLGAFDTLSYLMLSSNNNQWYK